MENSRIRCQGAPWVISFAAKSFFKPMGNHSFFYLIQLFYPIFTGIATANRGARNRFFARYLCTFHNQSARATGYAGIYPQK
jgi:hypothetical protein